MTATPPTPHSAEDRLAALGLSLPEAARPVASYVPTLIVGEQLWISGQVSATSDGQTVVGRLGDTLTLDAGQAAARLCALNILAQAKAALGTLDAIAQVIRLTGFVNATPDFPDHPKVINGASDLLQSVLGDAGKHTRSAVGVASLPFGFAVEIDAVLAIRG